MIDLTKPAEPRSDQLNADDLISGPRLLEITSIKVSSGEQPVQISYEGDNGKPWKPCKSMLRLMIHAWGKDGEKYVGRQLKVYCDPKVKWGGAEVGGIRISHMSHIDNPLRVMLTESRGRKSPHTVEPLHIEPLNKLSEEEFEAFKQDIGNCMEMSELQIVAAKIKEGKFDKEGAAKLREVYQNAVENVRKNNGELV